MANLAVVVLLGLIVLFFLASLVLQIVTVVQTSSINRTVNQVSSANDGQVLLDQSELMRNQLAGDLRKIEQHINTVSRLNQAAISYQQYKQSPATQANHRVLLKQADFAEGTVRLRSSGYYQLAEDIVFNPRPNHDWRPDRTNPEYEGPAFRLDFFAAITIEGSDIVLDLNGHTMEQSAAHALQQRFYAHIELADQPFISGQGPADFGASPLYAAHNTIVKNGRLGRSSHHGIHGNGGRRVLLENLDIADYEVAAVALNGFEDVLLQNVNALGTFSAIPVKGTYSNGRFLQPFVARALHLAQQPGGPASPAAVVQSLQESSQRLQTLMEQTFEDLVANGLPSIDAQSHPDAHGLFGNARQLMDGNCYGFLFNKLGVAVNGFADSASRPETSRRIVVEQCTVQSVVGSVGEVVALADYFTNDTVKGPAGDRLRLNDNHQPAIYPPIYDEDGTYHGNALTDTQLALIALVSQWPAPLQTQFGTLTKDPDNLLWHWRTGQTTLAKLVGEDKKFHYKRNGDTMFHVNKGLLGIRIDASSDVYLKSVKVHTVSNQGELGSGVVLPGELAENVPYRGAHDGGHPGQAPQAAYMGCDARGIGVAASHSVVLRHVSVEAVSSNGGLAHAIDVFNQAKDVVLMDITIDGVQTEGSQTHQGLKKASAVAIHTSADSRNVVLVDISMLDTEASDSVDQAYDQASTSAKQVSELREAATHLDKERAYLL